MKLLFLSIDWYRSKDPKTPLAMASIEAAYRLDPPSNLKSVFVSLDKAKEDFDVAQAIRIIDAEQPDIFALGVYIWNEAETQVILQHLSQKWPSCQVILGGPQVTFGDSNLPNEYPCCQWFIKGAGELPFRQLVNWIASGEINFIPQETLQDLGIHHKEMDKASYVGKIFTSKVNALPSPFLNGIIDLRHRQPFLRWETLRGCPYRCNFCQFKIDSMRPDKIGEERIFRELELFKALEIGEIAVLDPIFNFDPSHYLPILRKIHELEINTAFSFQARLELLTKPHGAEFLAFCRDHGKVKLEFGVQTFNEAESRAIQRNNRLDQIAKGISLLHQFQLDFDLHLIFGLPGQTIGSFWESYRKAKDARPNRIFVYPLNILKGTGIEIDAANAGYTWNPDDYNLLIASPWMNEAHVRELKSFSDDLNAYSKGLDYGQKGNWSSLKGLAG